MSVTVSDGHFQVSICHIVSGACTWRTCSLTDDGTQKYQNMHAIALQAETMNALNYGRVSMRWDTSNKCVALTAFAP
jgi:hypothetical protein